jgi:hypothetical protein
MWPMGEDYIKCEKIRAIAEEMAAKGLRVLALHSETSSDHRELIRTFGAI